MRAGGSAGNGPMDFGLDGGTARVTGASEGLGAPGAIVAGPMGSRA